MSKSKGKKDSILSWLNVRQAAGEIPPSLKEIAEECGIGSTSTVREYLAEMEKDGLIVWERGKNRSVRTAGVAQGAVGTTAEMGGVRKVPVMGTSGTVALDTALVDGEELIAVPGRLFARSDIGSGDYVIVDAAAEAEDGGMIATREQAGFRLRRYHPFMLEAIGGDDPVMIDNGRMPEGIEIIGVVRLEIRKR